MSLQSLYEGMEKRASDEDAFMRGFLGTMEKDAAFYRGPLIPRLRRRVREGVEALTGKEVKKFEGLLEGERASLTPAKRTKNIKRLVKAIPPAEAQVMWATHVTEAPFRGLEELVDYAKMKRRLARGVVGAGVAGTAAGAVGASMLQKKAAEKKKRPGRFAPAVGGIVGAVTGASLGRLLGRAAGPKGQLPGYLLGAASGGIVGTRAGQIIRERRGSTATKNVQKWNDRYNREWAKYKAEQGGGMKSRIGFDKAFRSQHGEKMPF